MMIRVLEFELDGSSRSTSQVRKVQPHDLFDSLFEPKNIKSITENYTNFDEQISYELERYKIQRLPTADVQSIGKMQIFYYYDAQHKFSSVSLHLLRLLSVCSARQAP